VRLNLLDQRMCWRGKGAPLQKKGPTMSESNWIPIVVLEISVEGDGLYWLTGQGDLSARGDELRWFALDANKSPEHNLELLRQVKEFPLEPGFAVEIEEIIQEYQQYMPDDEADPRRG
jgi:hypothetical protein